MSTNASAAYRCPQCGNPGNSAHWCSLAPTYTAPQPSAPDARERRVALVAQMAATLAGADAGNLRVEQQAEAAEWYVAYTTALLAAAERAVASEAAP